MISTALTFPVLLLLQIVQPTPLPDITCITNCASGVSIDNGVKRTNETNVLAKENDLGAGLIGLDFNYGRFGSRLYNQS